MMRESSNPYQAPVCQQADLGEGTVSYLSKSVECSRK